MFDASSVSLDGVFSVLSSTQSNRESLSTSALSRGARRMQEKDYEGAIVEFKRAAGYQPDSIDAQRYIARAYAAMGRTEEAIGAYKKAVQLDPTYSDVRNDLANYYMMNGRLADAEREFLRIAEDNPTAPGPATSLGYIYMQTDRLGEAEQQFLKVVRMAPRDAAAHYSLGLVYNKQERYTAAVDEFKQAIALRTGYAVAHADLAYSYIALGQQDNALDQLTALDAIDTDESRMLAYEIQLSMLKPRILYEDLVHGTFNSRYGPGTSLSELDASLAEPGAVNTFTMVLQFNSDMDIASVQNVLNWQISKADGGEGGVYNNGANLHPENEAWVTPMPSAVRYDPVTRTATIYFRVRQNPEGTAVIDPSHIVFGFSGVDASGDPMDPASDEYDWDGGAF